MTPAERIRKIDEDTAVNPEDKRPLSARLANDIYLIGRCEPHSQRWTEAMTRIRLELKELVEVEAQRKELARRLDSEIDMACRIRDCLEDFPKFANETKMADALGDALCGIRNTILNSEGSKAESKE